MVCSVVLYDFSLNRIFFFGFSNKILHLLLAETGAKANDCGEIAENTLMSTRTFSEHFHRFVEACLLRDTQNR